MAKIYFASNTNHFTKWLEPTYGDNFHENITTWPVNIGKVTESPNFAKAFWAQDFYDIRNCDALICYAEETDHLRGALVEVGYALAINRLVIVCGNCPDFGSWQYINHVYRCGTLEEAIAFVDLLTVSEAK